MATTGRLAQNDPCEEGCDGKEGWARPISGMDGLKKCMQSTSSSGVQCEKGLFGPW